jgi:two-component system, cell cycle response regulator DivK
MKTRILVVDDNPINLKLAGDILECEGYTVDRAEDAESALELIKRVPPRLILMDVALPGMDGYTLTKILKTDDSTKNIIVVALTAFAMKGDDQKAYDSGCDGYISKPIDTRNLVAVVSNQLERSKVEQYTGSGR